MAKLSFVAFSDPHVGRSWGTHCVPSARQLLTDRYLDPIKEVVKNYPDTPIFCGGDWFDRAHNPESLIKQSAPLLARMAGVLSGNHDHAGRESAVTSLQLTGELQRNHNIIMSPDHLNEAYADVQELGNVTIYTVPHHGTQALFEQACYECASDSDARPGHTVLIIHANVGSIGGGKPDSCLYLTPQLSAALEDSFNFILVGHEHLPRQMGKVIVMGSTQPCNFGELGPRFCYEFHDLGDKLSVEKVELKSTLKHAVIKMRPGEKVAELAGPVELIDLQGTLPMAQAKMVQKFVKDLFEAGTLAVRMGIIFDSGTGEVGQGEVQGSMRNLVDVVRSELKDKEVWLLIFDDALAEIHAEVQG